MKIRLRPYHLGYFVCYFGCLHLKVEDLRKAFWGSQLTTFTEKAYNEDGFNEVISKIKSNPDEIEIEVIQEFDDICIKCNKRIRDEKGSVWGERHSCSSSRDPRMVESINAENRIILQKLGLQFGSVITLKNLVKLLSNRMPVFTGLEKDSKWQESYEKGFSVLSLLLKQVETFDNTG